jgi:hypothetical protein
MRYGTRPDHGLSPQPSSTPNLAALTERHEMSPHQDTTEEDTPEMVLPAPDGAEWPSTSPDEAPTPPGRMVVLDPATELGSATTDDTPQVEMCCDGSGRAAEQHRAESADQKCCVDK